MAFRREGQKRQTRMFVVISHTAQASGGVCWVGKDRRAVRWLSAKPNYSAKACAVPTFRHFTGLLCTFEYRRPGGANGWMNRTADGPAVRPYLGQQVIEKTSALDS